MEHLKKLRANRIPLIGQDEEAGISYLNFEDYVKLRPEVYGTSIFEKFFAWGVPDFEKFKESTPENQIMITGSPRSFFWGKYGKEYYANQISNLQEKYGDYVLLVSNLGSKNNIWTKLEMKKYSRNSGYDTNYDMAANIRYDWEENAFAVTLTIIKRILEDSNLRIVLRPHPNENEEIWREIFERNPRVIISKTGDSLPHLFAAKHVLHAGSTVGIESLLTGQSTLSFHKLIGNPGVPMTANHYSASPENLDQLINMVSTDKEFKSLDGFKEVVENKLTRYDDIKVLQDQANQIKNVEFIEDLIYPETSRTKKLQINLKQNRYFQRLIYGKSSYLEIHKNKRPRIYLQDAQNHVSKLVKIMKIDSFMTVEELGESTFRISKI